MAINFNELPSSKPQSTLPAGYYMATIVKAEMKRSTNTGNEYLSLQYDLNNGAGVTGKLFDMQMDSEKEFLRYKLQRFLTALNLTLSGSFELKDLCKLVNGKKLIVDVTVDNNEQYGKRNAVNSFEHEIYYNINEWASLNAAPMDPMDAVEDNVPAPTDADAPAINAADALDSNEEY
jgi:hypothetical protein